jgi:hypothetical protein
MLPPMDGRGLLPEGIHNATISEVEARFCNSFLRESMFRKFKDFLEAELAPILGNAELFLCGSFLSDKESPSDIDCVVRVTRADIPLGWNLIDLQNDGRQPTAGVPGRIKARWGVDYWVDVSQLNPGGGDFVDFFQYVGLKSATAKALSCKDRRGIVRVVR